MAHDEGRAVELGDDVGNGKGLATAGDTLQHLCPLAIADAFNQLADGFRLVTHGGKVGFEVEVHWEVRIKS